MKLALLNDVGDELVSLVFNGEGTDSESWFSKARLISSPWDDLNANMSTEESNNDGKVFSVKG